jgi:hypothetical protein
LEHVKHIKTVTVDGYVKDSTKQGFEKALEASRKDPKGMRTWGVSKEMLLSLGPDDVSVIYL